MLLCQLVVKIVRFKKNLYFSIVFRDIFLCHSHLKSVFPFSGCLLRTAGGQVGPFVTPSAREPVLFLVAAAVNRIEREVSRLRVKSATASWARRLLHGSLRRTSVTSFGRQITPRQTEPPSHPQSIKFLRTRIFKDKE